MASAVTNGEEPPSKKKKKKTEPNSNPSLPHDLLLSCFARVSRLHYPTLSFVFKSFRSLLSSPELYKTRSLLNHTESCLYVCLRFPSDPNPHFFTLCRKPNGYVLAPISNHNSPQMDWSQLVITSTLFTNPLKLLHALMSRFWIAELTLGLKLQAFVLLTQVINMMGICVESLNCVEVFDTKTRIWKRVPREKRKFNLRDMEGKIFMNMKGVCSKKVVALNVEERKWEMLGVGTGFDSVSACDIDDITYRYNSYAEFEWCDELLALVGDWIKLKGLEGLPKFGCYSTVKLADYGGKMAVLWDEYVPGSECKEKTIWCAVISLEKRGNEEIWGKIEWFDAVLTVPKSFRV